MLSTAAGIEQIGGFLLCIVVYDGGVYALHLLVQKWQSSVMLVMKKLNVACSWACNEDEKIRVCSDHLSVLTSHHNCRKHVLHYIIGDTKQNKECGIAYSCEMCKVEDTKTIGDSILSPIMTLVTIEKSSKLIHTLGWTQQHVL